MIKVKLYAQNVQPKNPFGCSDLGGWYCSVYIILYILSFIEQYLDVNILGWFKCGDYAQNSGYVCTALTGLRIFLLLFMKKDGLLNVTVSEHIYHPARLGIGSHYSM